MVTQHLFIIPKIKPFNFTNGTENCLILWNLTSTGLLTVNLLINGHSLYIYGRTLTSSDIYRLAIILCKFQLN
ncbi:hypothetical protein I4U23_005086 [Adineta vaga]|nr:hypothetical protein I4U23_005086 [Adineta vaga]